MKILPINGLTQTISPDLVLEEMREDFTKLIGKINAIPPLNSITYLIAADLNVLLTQNQKFEPVAFNYILGALADDELFEKLVDLAQKNNQWFFNWFVIPSQIAIPGAKDTNGMLDHPIESELSFLDGLDPTLESPSHTETSPSDSN
jgi:hypothetical protein